ncbi:MAG: hypothetical protein CME70_08855 [Halobacteriovorax sp.]|nr:hypothetical protein [Halobacteriovorax sp.]|tara:strand:- start:73593 stop:76337 length:2745 start_codon:yes stop_codon:yes gene_type:complete
MNILVLATEQNFVWTSMQEIIPSIVHNWQSLSTEGHSVNTINVDKLDLKKDGAKFLKAEVLVVTAFNLDIHKALKVANEVFHFSGKTYFYLHNFSTIACWPLKKWDVLKYLKSSDVFVSSCSRDQKLCEKLFPKNTVLNIPFLLEQEIEKKRSQKEGPFVFIGRISEQKNLHNLLVAYSLYLKDSSLKRKLIFYGKEDFLGSPNMGKESSDYLDLLLRISQKLKLEEFVEFRGFVKRAEIYSELCELNYIFISPSIHSDENFGMAAFKSLCDGKRVMLSDWGGHSDYKTYFNNQLELIPVESSKRGPVITIENIYQGLSRVEEKETVEPNIPEHFQEKQILNCLVDSLKEDYKPSPIETSDLVEDVFRNRELFVEEGKESTSTKIFANYRDPLCEPFFKAYGMRDLRQNTVYKKSHYRFSPWCKIEGSQIIIADPHLGESRHKFEAGPAVASIEGTDKNISYELVKELLENNGIYMDGTTALRGKLFPDKCQTSIDLLKVKVLDYFSRNNLSTPQFADDFLNFNEENNAEVVNIVLFGGYLNRILESGNWPFRKMKLWVISHSVRHALCELFKFERDEIGVIPRYEIFSQVNSANWPELDKAEFVYAGRISRVKNIALLIKTFHRLQNKFNGVKLKLIGDFDSETHEYQGVFTVEDYQKEILALVESLSWHSKPEFIGKLAYDEWPKKLNANTTYISLSTYLSEDYAVSIAQAQENGTPVVCSNWGGHQEVSGKVLKIPTELLFPAGEEELLSLQIAEYLETHWGEEVKAEKSNSIKLPTEVSISKLDEMRREFCQKYGSQVLGLTKGMGPHFAESDEGKLLYNKWVKSLGKRGDFKTWVVLKSGFSDQNEEILKGLKNFGILYATELSHGDNLKRLCLAEKVILLLDEKESKKIGDLLRGMIGEERVSTPLVK